MLLGLLGVPGAARAQQAAVQTRPQLELSIGLAQPRLQGGAELNRARALRAAGQSYHAGAGGRRRAIGESSEPLGWCVGLGFYRPLPRVRGLLLGARVQNALTGATPADGGFAERYFFNYLSFGAAAKYYPLAKTNLFVGGDGGLGSVWTKNRFLNAAGEQEFLHQFGIGTSFGASAGYTLRPFASRDLALEIKAVWQAFRTRVEVNGIGDDQWRFQSLYYTLSVLL